MKCPDSCLCIHQIPFCDIDENYTTAASSSAAMATATTAVIEPATSASSTISSTTSDYPVTIGGWKYII